MKKLEIEIKAYCDNLDIIREKIISLGATYIKTNKETDVYFNHPLRDFAETDEALRIRQVNKNNIVTYKGPKISKKSKARIEEEVHISDIAQMSIILTYLGFVESGNVLKTREYFKLHDIEICLDKVDILGNFVELEKIGSDLHKTEATLYILAEKMGLKKFEPRSYLELILNYG